MRFNGKPDLTSIQLQERARRRRERMKMRGLPAPPGTKPSVFMRTGEPIFKPMAAGPVSVLDMGRLTMVLPWLLRRKGKREVNTPERW
jgi:hypothetical protein